MNGFPCNRAWTNSEFYAELVLQKVQLFLPGFYFCYFILELRKFLQSRNHSFVLLIFSPGKTSKNTMINLLNSVANIFIIILCISWSFVRNLVWIYSSMFLFLSFLIGLLTADVAVHFISFICVVNFVGNIVYLKVWYYIYLGICRSANRD